MLPVIPVHTTIPIVPFYSQFSDIHALSWQKIGCGIASLAMIVDYYSTENISVDELLEKGIRNGAYDKKAGWRHKDLISLANNYGLMGNSYDVSSLSKEAAFTELKTVLADGPVIVSIHYKFNPKNLIPHLVVLDGITDGVIYYNDPAAKSGQKQISIADFQKGWKEKFIVIRPA